MSIILTNWKDNYWVEYGTESNNKKLTEGVFTDILLQKMNRTMRIIMKKYIQNIKIFVIENPLFFLSIVITTIFIICPLLLRNNWLVYIISEFLKPLREQGFKSSYVETLGAILGTFLAISGALWTQKRFDIKEENEKKREHILIVYYDFFFVFQDIYSCMNNYMNKRGIIENFLSDEDLFIDSVKYLKIYIHDEWISNVASIAKYFTDEEVKKIYEIYGELSTIKNMFEKDLDYITKREMENVFRIMHKHIIPCINLFNADVTVELKEDTKKIMNLLGKVGGINLLLY